MAGGLTFHKASRESDGFIWRSKSPWKSLLAVPYSVIPHLLPQPKDMIWNAWHDMTQTPHCSGFTGRFTVCSHWTFTTSSWWFSTWCSHYEEASTPAKLLTAREREEPMAWPMSHKRHSHSHLIGPCKSHVNNCMAQYKPQVQKISQLSLVNNTKSHHKHYT